VLSPEERRRRQMLADKRNEQTRRQAAVHESERAITADPVRALAYLEGFVAGHDAEVDPTVIADRLALGAIHVDPALGVALDRITAQLCERWKTVRLGPWSQATLFGWPGLPRHARAAADVAAGARQLRADMREALPGLATAEGWRRVRRLVVPFEHNTTPWADLSLLAARLHDEPDADDDPY
jgi:hypothetical protein